MTYCCVKTCTNGSKTCSFLKNGITFHRFPREAKYKKKWIAATGKKNWTPTPNSTICSVHFADGCISKSSNETHRRYLFFNAIPTQFLPEKEEGDVSDDEDDIDDPPANTNNINTNNTDTNNSEDTTPITNNIIADDPMLSSVANFEDTQCATGSAFNPLPPSEVYGGPQPLSSSEFEPLLMLPASGATFVDTTTESSNLTAFDLLPPSETIAEDGTVSSLLSLGAPIDNTVPKKKDSAVTNIEAAIDLLSANNFEDGKSGKKTAGKKRKPKKDKLTEEEAASDKPANAKKRRKPLANNNTGESVNQEGNNTNSKDNRVTAKKRKPSRKTVTVTDYDLLLASYKSAKSNPSGTSKLAELLMKPKGPASKNYKAELKGNTEDVFEQLLASSKNSKDVPSIKDKLVGCEINSELHGSLSNKKPYQSLDDPKSDEDISNSLSDTETAFDSLLASFKSSREKMKQSMACDKNQISETETCTDKNKTDDSSSKTDKDSVSVETSNKDGQIADKTESKNDRSSINNAHSKDDADMESRKKDTHSNNDKISEKVLQPANITFHKTSRAYNLVLDKEKQIKDHMDKVKKDRRSEDIPHFKKEKKGRHSSNIKTFKRDRRTENIRSSKIDLHPDDVPLAKLYRCKKDDPASKKYRRANKNRPAEKDTSKKEKTEINCTALFDLLPPTTVIVHTQNDRSRNDGDKVQDENKKAANNVASFGDETSQIRGPASNNEEALNLSTMATIVSEDVARYKDLASIEAYSASHIPSENGNTACDGEVAYSITESNVSSAGSYLIPQEPQLDNTDTNEYDYSDEALDLSVTTTGSPSSNNILSENKIVTNNVTTLNTLTNVTRTYEQSPSARNYLASFDPRSPVMAPEAEIASNNLSEVDCLPSYAATFGQCANGYLESSDFHSVPNDVDFNGNRKSAIDLSLSGTTNVDNQLTNNLAPIVPAANTLVLEETLAENQTVLILSDVTNNYEVTQVNNGGAVFAADITLSNDRSGTNDMPLDLSLSSRSNVTEFDLLSSCQTNYERNHPGAVETFELLPVGSSNYVDRQPNMAVLDLLASIPSTIDNRLPTNSGPAFNLIPAFTENQPNTTNEVFEEMPVNLTNYVQHNSASTTADFNLLPNGIVNFEATHNNSAAELNRSATGFKENQSTSYNMDLDFLPISPSNFDDQSTNNNATFDICTYVNDQSIGCDAAVLDLLPLGNDTFEEQTTSDNAAALDLSSNATDLSEVQLNSLMQTALTEFCASIAAKFKPQTGSASSINISSLQARLASKLQRLPPIFQTDQETQCDAIQKVTESKELSSKLARKDKQLKILRSQVDFLNKKVETLRQSVKILQKRNGGAKNGDVRQRKNKILKQRKIASKNGRIITKITLMVRPRDGDCADSVNQALASTVK